jgi:hypothetical protein
MHDAFCRPRDTKMTHQAILARSEQNLSGVWDQVAMPKLTRGVEPKIDVDKEDWHAYTTHPLLECDRRSPALGAGVRYEFCPGISDSRED